MDVIRMNVIRMDVIRMNVIRMDVIRMDVIRTGDWRRARITDILHQSLADSPACRSQLPEARRDVVQVKRKTLKRACLCSSGPIEEMPMFRTFALVRRKTLLLVALLLLGLAAPIKWTRSGPAVAQACASGSCKPKPNWDCIIDNITRHNKCDTAVKGCLDGPT